jgi:uncharacterized protein (DUF2235 family)
MRRLALFLDRTWNQVSDNTNFWRFRALFAPVDTDGRAQLGFYSTGLGTKFGEKMARVVIRAADGDVIPFQRPAE